FHVLQSAKRLASAHVKRRHRQAEIDDRLCVFARERQPDGELFGRHYLDPVEWADTGLLHLASRYLNIRDRMVAGRAAEFFDVPRRRERAPVAVVPCVQTVEPLFRRTDQEREKKPLFVEAAELGRDLIAQNGLEKLALAIAEKRVFADRPRKHS